MYHGNPHHCQHGFVSMSYEGGRDCPAGQELGRKYRVHHDETRDADNRHAPEYGPVVELLPPVEPVEFGFLFDQANEISHLLEEVFEVFDDRDHSFGEGFLQNEYVIAKVEHVIDAIEDHCPSRHAVNRAHNIYPAPGTNPPLADPPIVEFHWQPRECQ